MLLLKLIKVIKNHILLYGGTNKEIDFEYIDEVLSHFSTGDVVVLQNEINNVPYIIDRCYEKEMKIFSMQLLMMNQFKIIQLKKSNMACSQ